MHPHCPHLASQDLALGLPVQLILYCLSCCFLTVQYAAQDAGQELAYRPDAMLSCQGVV